MSADLNKNLFYDQMFSFMEGVFHMEMKQYDEAIKHLDKIRRLADSNDDTREKIVRNFICMVLASLLKKDFESAKKHMNTIFWYQQSSDERFSQSYYIENYVIKTMLFFCPKTI